MFELFFHRPAREFFDSLEEEDRIEVRRLVKIISLEPFWDNVHKFQVPISDEDGNLIGFSSIYESGRFTISYRVVSNDMVHIEGIAPSEYNEESS